MNQEKQQEVINHYYPMSNKKKASELIFVSQIKRDGSGTVKVSKSYLKAMLGNSLMEQETFELRCLSISEHTYIAHGFNSFIVKLKSDDN